MKLSTISKDLIISIPLLISTRGSISLLCLVGDPDLPVEPQDEAGLTKKFET